MLTLCGWYEPMVDTVFFDERYFLLHDADALFMCPIISYFSADFE